MTNLSLGRRAGQGERLGGLLPLSDYETKRNELQGENERLGRGIECRQRCGDRRSRDDCRRISDWLESYWCATREDHNASQTAWPVTHSESSTSVQRHGERSEKDCRNDNDRDHGQHARLHGR